MRLIDADALIAWTDNYYDSEKFTVGRFANMVKDMPTVEPERKPGHWILDRSGSYCCSECLEPCATYVMMKPRDKFCKMCGADMRGDKHVN